MTQTPYARSFARHETFHPRFGWLRKAVIASGADPYVFLATDATSRLGVGKNMVRAIRYWGAAFALLEETPLPNRPRLLGHRPSPLGSFLVGPNGVDAYLEELASLWLLHWQLVRAGSVAPTWYLTFNRFPQRDFVPDDLVSWLERELARNGVESVARSSLEKDVSCLLRMYLPASSTHVETTLTSPFSILRLIDPVSSRGARVRLTYGPKAGLPPELVAIVALDAMRSSGTRSQSIHIGKLAVIEAGPGRVFGLSETEIASALEAVAMKYRGVEVGVLAGARRFSVSSDLIVSSRCFFEGIYPGARMDLSLLPTPWEQAA